MAGTMRRRLAEFLGSLFLAGAVIGSGILAVEVSAGNDGVAVTLASGLRSEIELFLGVLYVISKVLGCVARFLAAAGLTPRSALRETKSPAAELGLLDEGATAETILAAMLEHPVLVNRPIVATPRGIRLCRPSETLLDLLDQRPTEPVYKEDGELVWAPK